MPLDPLRRLLTSPDPAVVRQGLELARAADAAWFDEALRKVTFTGNVTRRGFIRHQVHGAGVLRWAALALALDAPEGSAEAARVRATITSLALGPLHRVPLDCARLAALPNLEALCLRRIGRVRSLGALAQLPRLRWLVLARCEEIDPLQGRFPALERLTLSRLPLADLGGFAAPPLEELTIERLPLVRLEGLSARRLRLQDLPLLERAALGGRREEPGGRPSYALFYSLGALRELRWSGDSPAVPDLPGGLRRLRLELPALGRRPRLPSELRELSLVLQERPESLAPLLALRQLRRLDLAGVPGPLDLAPLRSLPALEELILSGDQLRAAPPDLAALALHNTKAKEHER